MVTRSIVGKGGTVAESSRGVRTQCVGDRGRRALPRGVRLRAFAACVLFGSVLAWPSSAAAAPTPITVSSASDSGPGTLRDAILEANGNPNPQGSAITFGAELTIKTASPLPALTRTASIENGGHVVVIDGSGQGSGDDLAIDAPNSAVRGLTLVNAPGNGLTLGPGSDGTAVGGGSSSNAVNFIGATKAAVAEPNGGFGIAITGGSGSVIGEYSPAQFSNVIEDNRLGNVLIQAPATGDAVVNNIIELSEAGKSGPGIEIEGSSNNQLGGHPSASAGNLIALNAGDGVKLTGTAAEGNQVLENTITLNKGGGVNLGGAGDRNALIQNSITSNEGLGITLLGTTTPKPNAASNPGPGPNESQNYPVITEVNTGTNTISGTLHSVPSTTFTVDLFGNGACDSSGFGQGGNYLGSATVSTNGSGDGSFEFTSKVALAGVTVTAQARDPLGNSSEFSQCSPQFAGPHITLSVVELPFANQLLGTASPVTFVNASNTGSAATTLSSFIVSGPFTPDPGNSGSAPSCEAGLTLSPGQSCDFGLHFTPAGAGPAPGRLDATFTGTKPLTVLLSGIGITQLPSVPTAPTPSSPRTTVNPTVGRPAVGSGSLSGLRSGRPHLTLTVGSGANAPGLKSVAVRLPRGLKFSSSFRKKHKGLKISGGVIRSVKVTSTGLIMVLKSPVSHLTVTLGGSALAESGALESMVKSHKITQLKFAVTVTDASNLTTSLAFSVRHPK